MPFPSRGCQTCRKRRIKCDETSPSCNQCTRLGHQCPGFSWEAGTLPFRSENTFAKGTARKPRKQSTEITRSSTHVILNQDIVVQLRKHCSIQSAPTEKSSSNLHSNHIRRLEQVSRPLSDPIENQALANFARTYIDPPAPENTWAYVKELWPTLDPTSALGLSSTAVSFATFSKLSSDPEATKMGNQRYMKAVMKIRTGMSDIEEVTSDNFLLGVLLLSKYENTLGNYKDNSLVSSSFWHEKGVTAVFKARRDYGPSSKQNPGLDKHVRRQLIRTSINRGTRLPTWLQNGIAFGEDGTDLVLDRCLVEVSRLRCDSLALWAKSNRISRSESLIFSTLLRNSILDCKDIDEKLEDWPMSLPAEWAFHTVVNRVSMDQRTSYDGTVHTYPSWRVSVAWNQYRGARLICNSIILKALSYLFSTSFEAPSDEDLRTRRVAQTNIQALVNDVCASIPFHLARTEGVDQKRSHCEDIRSTNAIVAFTLVWPLLISSAVRGVSEEQRRWIKAQLRLVGQITASDALQSIAAER